MTNPYMLRTSAGGGGGARSSCGAQKFYQKKKTFFTAFTVENMLVFLEYIFQFLISKTLLASNGVDRQNFIGKRCKDDTFSILFGAGFRGAIGNASSYFVGGPGFNTCFRYYFFFFFFVFFVVVFFLYFS